MQKKIKVTKNGPYLVTGNIPLNNESIISDKDDMPLNWGKKEKFPVREKYSLCRCGKSINKPYCDGTHEKISFNGTETASYKKYNEMKQDYAGPDLILEDAEELCAGAGFCDRATGAWELVKSADKNKQEILKEEVCNCPSGRLVLRDKKTNKIIEPELEPEISATKMPGKGLAGPLFIKGGVEIKSAEGKLYEKRNRVTLCRCGHSKNKPFCDYTHEKIKFSDNI